MNTRKQFFTLFFVLPIINLLGAMDATAQAKEPYRNSNYFDFAVSGATERFSGALSWSHVNKITKVLPRLKVGYGIRLTSFVAANKFYVTAPAEYTSPVQGLGTIFSETIQENIDTITTATAATNSLNVPIYIQYSIHQGSTSALISMSLGSALEQKKNLMLSPVPLIPTSLLSLVESRLLLTCF